MTARVLNLPLPPALGNARGHSRALTKPKHAYWRDCDFYLLADGQEPPVTPWPRVELRAHIVCGHTMDDDNAVRRLKWVLDYLVNRRWIEDDSKQHILWPAGFPTQRVTRDERLHCVELTIEPVAVPVSDVRKKSRAKAMRFPALAEGDLATPPHASDELRQRIQLENDRRAALRKAAG